MARCGEPSGLVDQLREPVLIVGGAGFVGPRLLARLEIAGGGGMVVDPRSLEEAVESLRPRCVVQLAAPADLLPGGGGDEAQGLVLGLVRLMDACAAHDVRRVVIAVPGCALAPSGVDRLVRSAELYAGFRARLRGLRWVSLLLAHVYGPGEPLGRGASVPTQLLDAARRGGPLMLDGSCALTGDLVYVDDVVEALVAALARSEVEGRIPVGSGRLVTATDLLAAVAGLTGAPALIGLPVPVRHRCAPADVVSARRTLGWRASTPLEAGLAATAEAMGVPLPDVARPPATR